jgi:hypothetical protein
MTRGIIYVFWGTKFKQEMERSVESVKRHHPELPIHFIDLTGEAKDHRAKSTMLDLTPFDVTLYLDTDTVVLDRLDFGFERAEKHGLACCINECPWGRRYASLTGDCVEYNTGVMFFTKKARPVFDAWRACAGHMDQDLRFYLGKDVVHQPTADQGIFAKAMIETDFNPYVLPLNWNMRPIWHKAFFGPIKVWHDHSNVPDWLKFWNEDQVPEPSIMKFHWTRQ